MGRAPRMDISDVLYHVINRGNARGTIFYTPEDYLHFENLLFKAVNRFDMRLIAHTLMPNHWHLILYPKKDGDLAVFMQWLTLTHTQQYHARRQTAGYGHIYQGRYKSFPIQTEGYLLTAIKYVERNSLRAKLVTRVEDWHWGSGYHRINTTPVGQKIILDTPIELPRNYKVWVNENDKNIDDIDNIRISKDKGKPFGSVEWTKYIVEQFDLEVTVHKRGRPRKGT